jgi:hypothetical protein
MYTFRLLAVDTSNFKIFQALSAPGRSKFGSGNKNFLLDEVDCHGNETSLLSCDSNSLKEHDCQDFEVAGVYCQQTKGKFTSTRS